MEIFKFLFGVVTQTHFTSKDIIYKRAKKIEITSNVKALAHVDCELIGTTPLKIEVCPKAINVICQK